MPVCLIDTMLLCCSRKLGKDTFTSFLIGEVKTYIAARNLIDFQINITSQKH